MVGICRLRFLFAVTPCIEIISRVEGSVKYALIVFRRRFYCIQALCLFFIFCSLAAPTPPYITPEQRVDIEGKILFCVLQSGDNIYVDRKLVCDWGEELRVRGVGDLLVYTAMQ